MKISKIYLYADSYQFAVREGLISLDEAKEIARKIILENTRPNLTETLWACFLDENFDEIFTERIKFDVNKQIWE